MMSSGPAMLEPMPTRPVRPAFGPTAVPRDPIRVLDLFAGAGGLSAGLHRGSSRFDVVRAVEMDGAASATYEASFGKGLVYNGPIQDWLRDEEVPDVDVIVGGPPCQGFSLLGKQDELDERNSLWEQYAATIARARPKFFIVENVAAFAKSRQFQDFQEATARGGMLSDYAFQHRVLNAADYGAYQARKRAVLVGHHRDLSFPGFPEPTHLGDHLRVRQAFAAIPVHTPGNELPEREYTFNGRTYPGQFAASELHIGRDYAPISLQRFAAIPPGGNRFDIPDDLLAPCWRKHRSGSGDVMGRLHWEKPSVTIRTEFFKPEKGRYLHPEANRAITHYEAAVLQGFPDSHRFVGSKTAIARQIGNAVPIPLGAAIGRHLAASL